MKTLKKYSSVLLLLLMILSLAACGGEKELSGTYEATVGDPFNPFGSGAAYYSIEFAGNEYSMSYNKGNTRGWSEGTYSLNKKRDYIEFIDTNGTAEVVSFMQMENSILLDGVTYTRTRDGTAFAPINVP